MVIRQIVRAGVYLAVRRCAAGVAVQFAGVKIAGNAVVRAEDAVPLPEPPDGETGIAHGAGAFGCVHCMYVKIVVESPLFIM